MPVGRLTLEVKNTEEEGAKEMEERVNNCR